MTRFSLYPLGGLGGQIFDNTGTPLAGGEVYTYEADTDTPLVTYADPYGRTPRTNPIILDSAGRVPDSGMVFIVPNQPYRFVIARREFVVREINNVITNPESGGTEDPRPPAYSTSIPTFNISLPTNPTTFIMPLRLEDASENSEIIMESINQDFGVGGYMAIDATRFPNLTWDVYSTAFFPGTAAQVNFDIERSDTPDFASFTVVSAANPVSGIIGYTQPLRIQINSGYYRIRVRTLGSFSSAQVINFLITGVAALV